MALWMRNDSKLRALGARHSTLTRASSWCVLPRRRRARPSDGCHGDNIRCKTAEELRQNVVTDPAEAVGDNRLKELKNFVPGIFQLAAARYMPALRSLNQRLTPLIQAGASCPGRKR